MCTWGTNRQEHIDRESKLFSFFSTHINKQQPKLLTMSRTVKSTLICTVNTPARRMRFSKQQKSHAYVKPEGCTQEDLLNCGGKTETIISWVFITWQKYYSVSSTTKLQQHLLAHSSLWWRMRTEWKIMFKRANIKSTFLSLSRFYILCP